MRISPKNAGQIPNTYDSSSLVPNHFLSENTIIQIYFKNILFSVWVPNSEERKSNLRKPYLGVLVRIAESLYSGGSASLSGSAPEYARSGSASVSVSGFESIISPNINLN
jgi:hypothetical protein